MYTWGYIKEVSLSKLDLSEEHEHEDEVFVQTLVSRFPFYANEAITQICSSVKPKHTFAEFNITDDQIGVPQTMPSDFISFGDDVSYQVVTTYNIAESVELHDDDIVYHGYNKVVFKHAGVFYVSYNARWYMFNKSLPDTTEIDVPYDILDAIPSYIASQCYRVDDEYKAQVFRNKYEMMLARIDNSNYKNTKTIKISGGW